MKTFSDGVGNLVIRTSQKNFQRISLLSSSVRIKVKLLSLPVG